MIRLQFIGHLGHDAIQRNINGKSVLNFHVAHTRRFKDQQGQLQEKTLWVDCAYWEHEKAGPYLTKGRQVYVDGTPSLEMYDNREGERVAVLRLHVHNMQLCAEKKGRDAEQLAEEQAAAGEVTDDLPF